MRENEMANEQKIRAQAARAAKAGKSIMDCPYRTGTNRHLWRQAFREARQILDWAKSTAGYEPR
jgi:ribosome modulation factor